MNEEPEQYVKRVQSCSLKLEKVLGAFCVFPRAPPFICHMTSKGVT